MAFGSAWLFGLIAKALFATTPSQLFGVFIGMIVGTLMITSLCEAWRSCRERWYHQLIHMYMLFGSSVLMGLIGSIVIAPLAALYGVTRGMCEGIGLLVGFVAAPLMLGKLEDYWIYTPESKTPTRSARTSGGENGIQEDRQEDIQKDGQEDIQKDRQEDRVTYGKRYKAAAWREMQEQFQRRREAYLRDHVGKKEPPDA